MSPHLASRHEVGQILRSSGVPTIEFRASIVIGSGSVSYEIVRALVDSPPVMISPVGSRPRPADRYRRRNSSTCSPQSTSSPGPCSSRSAARTESLTPRSSESTRGSAASRTRDSPAARHPTGLALLVGLITPVYGRVAGEMVESLRNDTVVRTAPLAKRSRCGRVA